MESKKQPFNCYKIFVTIGIYAIVLSNNVLRILATASSQLIGTVLPAFQLSLMRFSLLLTISIVVLVASNASANVSRVDCAKLLGMSFVMFMYMMAFYSSVDFAQVGNLIATSVVVKLTGTLLVNAWNRKFFCPIICDSSYCIYWSISLNPT